MNIKLIKNIRKVKERSKWHRLLSKKRSFNSQTSAEILQHKVGSFERSQRNIYIPQHKNMLPANKLKLMHCCCCTESKVNLTPLGVLVRKDKKRTPKQIPLERLLNQIHDLYEGVKWKSGKSESVSLWAHHSAVKVDSNYMHCIAKVYLHWLTHLYSVYLLEFTEFFLITFSGKIWVLSCSYSFETSLWLYQLHAAGQELVIVTCLQNIIFCCCHGILPVAQVISSL